MCRRIVSVLIAAGWLAVGLGPAPVGAQVCGPLDDGRLAEVVYEGTAVFFEPIVEYREMVLTVGGPCEDIVRVFRKGEQISFDLREITKVTDGSYTWELRRVADIDPGVQEALLKARGTGEEDAIWWNFFQKGAIPEGPYVESGSFAVERGVVIGPGGGEEKRAAVGSKAGTALAGAVLAGGEAGGSAEGEGGGNRLATRDQVIPDDLIVQGSECVGFDCVNGESFGFDTIRLKENNLRIQFNDTSSVAGFPTHNWQIRANSSSSGGESFLGFVDQGSNDTSETGTLVFVVEAGAGANALRVDNTGRVGLGTANPVLDLHISSTNTPALRLEQTSAGGFTAQTWDIAGNEANFFVRDVTGGSRLPLRIRPGAPTSSVDIAGDGQVGIGTASPDRRLHVIDSGAPDNTVLEIENNGATRLRIHNSSNGEIWNLGHQSPSGSGLVFSDVGDAVSEMLLDVSGNMTIAGSLTVGPGGCTGCDLVFSPGYEIESIEEHASYMWTNSHLPGVGPTPEDAPMNLSQKTGGILNELEKAHIYIEQLHSQVESLQTLLGDRDETLAEVLARLERLEAEGGSARSPSPR